MNESPLAPLSDRQREIMELVWNHDELTVTEVQNLMENEGSQLSRNTVQTLMVRMEEKGWLVHREVGRTFFYKAAQPRSASQQKAVEQLLDSTFRGSVEQLVNSLLETRKLGHGEAERIRQMIDDAESKSKKKN